MSVPQHKPGQPVVGFNHNLSHQGRVFHVQTEDSGPQHGHIITHLFMGGNILASVKSSYADRLPDLAPGEVFAMVRKLMEDQHKAMMKALAQGAHDEEIARRTGGPVYQPGVLAGGSQAPGLLVGGTKPDSLPPVPRAPPPKAPMASSLTSRRPLATAAQPSPPVMVPGAISMLTPVPPPRASASKPLDEVLLAYLAASEFGSTTR